MIRWQVSPYFLNLYRKNWVEVLLVLRHFKGIEPSSRDLSRLKRR